MPTSKAYLFELCMAICKGEGSLLSMDPVSFINIRNQRYFVNMKLSVLFLCYNI